MSVSYDPGAEMGGGMRTPIALAFIVALLTASVAAQIPGSGNVFLGYSYLRRDLNGNEHNNANGWNGSLEGKVLPFVGIVGDFSGHYGSGAPGLICVVPVPGTPCSSLDAKMHTFLFGPRLSASIGGIRPYAHALFGASHISTSGSAVSDTSFAEAIGGGVDFGLLHFFAWRVQGDLLQTRFFGANTQNNLRLSTGIVLRF
jgi:hypothetical protein